MCVVSGVGIKGPAPLLSSHWGSFGGGADALPLMAEPMGTTETTMS
jgi:hypothetical protein